MGGEQSVSFTEDQVIQKCYEIKDKISDKICATVPSSSLTTSPSNLLSATVTEPTIPKDIDTKQEFQTILDEHNRARALNGLSALRWNQEMAQRAQAWADQLGKSCSMYHPREDVSVDCGGVQKTEKQCFMSNGQGGFDGQNLFFALSSAPQLNFAEYPKTAVKRWYDECLLYDPNEMENGVPKNFKDVGHFSAVMWAKNSDLGCARSTCQKDQLSGILWVCNYGNTNVQGEFGQNVKKPEQCLDINNTGI